MTTQVPVTGLVAYEKAVYETNEHRFVDVHYIGDYHERKTECTDPSTNTVSLEGFRPLTTIHKTNDNS